MENASKALIIAGAILIAILLISVGMLILRSADGVVGNAKESMSAQEIEVFNQQFENYIGEQKGSSVRTLMSKVKASNATHDDDHKVKVEVSGISGVTANKDTKLGGSDPDSVSSKIRPTTTYNISIVSNPESALIETITVTYGSTTDTPSET